ncbi:hypothetical protein [Ralstonia sp. NFACC01]|uniref:hypothetical protein n=1 Tax=Ralstonia sp. NFACC01 TaxID=1566294 RepID=UPI0008F03A24|nr:hypothetical protein [Ralstonia sp. NFACC01]SFO86166.1 hypothetical protein SAMN03159417_00368 [Ralstonia sp. NFACC01]
MTVQQLIEILRTYPADARVVVDSCEFGYDDVSTVVKQPLLIGANKIPHACVFGRAEKHAPADYGAGEHDVPNGGEPYDELAVRVSGGSR